MPDRPLRPCKKPGCRNLTRSGWCDEHKPVYRDDRGSANSRGYTARWRRERARYLAEHPWCAECQRQGRLEPATEVDHIVPHKGDQALFWDRGNWQGLCKRCHSRKTAGEDGGFGNRARGYPPPLGNKG